MIDPKWLRCYMWSPQKKRGREEGSERKEGSRWVGFGGEEAVGIGGNGNLVHYRKRRGTRAHQKVRLPSVEKVALRGIDRDGGGRRLCREAKNWRAQK
jgi:hypothetical protein